MIVFAQNTFGNDSERSGQITAALSNRVPVVHDFVGHANQVTQIHQVGHLAIMLYDKSVSSVPYLLFGCGPSTVLGRVRPVVVDAVNRSVCWALSHIGQEILERLPTLTHVNPTTTVKQVRMVIRVFASAFHGHPRYMLRGSAHSMAQIVPFKLQAPARCCSAVADVGSISIKRLTAIAGHSPDRPAFFSGADRTNSNKATKPLPSEVNETRVSRIMKFHIGNSITNTCSQERVTRCMDAQ